MAQPPSPIEIKRLAGEGLSLRWSDGLSVTVPNATLRNNCPCATCRDQRGEASHDTPIAPEKPKKSSFLKVVEHTAAESTDLKSVWAIGNYAIGIEWGDKHNSGIYTYELLRTLSEAKR